MTDMGSAMAKTFLALLMLAGLISSSRAATYKVGGTTTWTLGITPTFYDDWAAGIDLVAGDVLDFAYPGNSHNVFEVTKADLTSCNINNPIKTYDTLGGASVTVTSGYHGYICGIPGHCAGFMKMNVQVGTATAAAPAIAPVAAPTIAPPATNGTIPVTPPAPAVNATSPTTSPAPTGNATSPTTSPVPAALTPPSAPPTPVPTAVTPAPTRPATPPTLSPPAPIALTPTTTPTATSPGTLASAPGPSPGENGASALRSTSLTIAGIFLCALPALMFY